MAQSHLVGDSGQIKLEENQKGWLATPTWVVVPIGVLPFVACLVVRCRLPTQHLDTLNCLLGYFPRGGGGDVKCKWGRFLPVCILIFTDKSLRRRLPRNWCKLLSIMRNIQNFELALSICKKRQEVPAFWVRGLEGQVPSWLRFWWNLWGEWARTDGRWPEEDEARHEERLHGLPNHPMAAPWQPVLPRIGLTGPAVLGLPRPFPQKRRRREEEENEEEKWPFWSCRVEWSRRGNVVVGTKRFSEWKGGGSSSIQPVHVFHIHPQCQTNM